MSDSDRDDDKGTIREEENENEDSTEDVIYEADDLFSDKE